MFVGESVAEHGDAVFGEDAFDEHDAVAQLDAAADQRPGGGGHRRQAEQFPAGEVERDRVVVVDGVDVDCCE